MQRRRIPLTAMLQIWRADPPLVSTPSNTGHSQAMCSRRFLYAYALSFLSPSFLAHKAAAFDLPRVDLLFDVKSCPVSDAALT